MARYHAVHGRTTGEVDRDVWDGAEVLTEGRGMARASIERIKAHVAVTELQGLDKVLGFGEIIVVWYDTLTEGRERVLGVALHRGKEGRETSGSKLGLEFGLLRPSFL